MLAFAHLRGLPAEVDLGELDKTKLADPMAVVERIAAQLLGGHVSSRAVVQSESAAQPVPEGGTLRFIPVADGIEFDPPQRSFSWRARETAHAEQFQLRADERLDGRETEARLLVFYGRILFAEVPFRIEVRATAAMSPQPVRSSRPCHRKIYASYSPEDRDVVDEFERVASAVGDIRIVLSEVWSLGTPRLIADADVFQLFWSSNALRSAGVLRELQCAIRLRRPNFIRPVYWEDPLPQDPAKDLPPKELKHVYFYPLAGGVPRTLTQLAARTMTVEPKPVEPPAESAKPTPAPLATGPFDVFLSFKQEDLAHAQKVYEYLRTRGVRVFFSHESLLEQRNAEFMNVIAQALDGCTHMLVVGSSRRHIEARWVSNEWQTFLNDRNAGRKSGNLMTIRAGGLAVADLPPLLRAFQSFELTAEGLSQVAKYVTRAPAEPSGVVESPAAAPPAAAPPAGPATPPAATPGAYEALFPKRPAGASAVSLRWDVPGAEPASLAPQPETKTPEPKPLRVAPAPPRVEEQSAALQRTPPPAPEPAAARVRAPEKPKPPQPVPRTKSRRRVVVPGASVAVLTLLVGAYFALRPPKDTGKTSPPPPIVGGGGGKTGGTRGQPPIADTLRAELDVATKLEAAGKHVEALEQVRGTVRKIQEVAGSRPVDTDLALLLEQANRQKRRLEYRVDLAKPTLKEVLAIAVRIREDRDKNPNDRDIPHLLDEAISKGLIQASELHKQAGTQSDPIKALAHYEAAYRAYSNLAGLAGGSTRESAAIGGRQKVLDDLLQLGKRCLPDKPDDARDIASSILDILAVDSPAARDLRKQADAVTSLTNAEAKINEGRAVEAAVLIEGLGDPEFVFREHPTLVPRAYLTGARAAAQMQPPRHDVVNEFLAKLQPLSLTPAQAEIRLALEALTSAPEGDEKVAKERADRRAAALAKFRAPNSLPKWEQDAIGALIAKTATNATTRMWDLANTDPDGALKLANSLLTDNPKNVDAWLLKALVSARKKDPKTAAQAIAQARDGKPDTDQAAHLEEIALLVTGQDSAKAGEVFDEIADRVKKSRGRHLAELADVLTTVAEQQPMDRLAPALEAINAARRAAASNAASNDMLIELTKQRDRLLVIRVPWMATQEDFEAVYNELRTDYGETASATLPGYLRVLFAESAVEGPARTLLVQLEIQSLTKTEQTDLTGYLQHAQKLLDDPASRAALGQTGGYADYVRALVWAGQAAPLRGNERAAKLGLAADALIQSWDTSKPAPQWLVDRRQARYFDNDGILVQAARALPRGDAKNPFALQRFDTPETADKAFRWLQAAQQAGAATQKALDLAARVDLALAAGQRPTADAGLQALVSKTIDDLGEGLGNHPDRYRLLRLAAQGAKDKEPAKALQFYERSLNLAKTELRVTNLTQAVMQPLTVWTEILKPAIALADGLLQASPSDPELKQKAARLFALQGSLILEDRYANWEFEDAVQAALGAYDRAIQLDNRVADYFVGRADARSRLPNSDLDKIRDDAKEAMKLDPKLPRGHSLYGVALVRAWRAQDTPEDISRLNEAVTSFNQAVILFGDQPDALQHLSTTLINRSNAFVALANFDEANKASHLNQAQADARWVTGEKMLARARYPEFANAALGIVLEAVADFQKPELFKEAADAFQAVIRAQGELRETAQSYVDLGRCYYKWSRKDAPNAKEYLARAVTNLTEATKRADRTAEAYYYLGLALRRQGEAGAELDALKQAELDALKQAELDALKQAVATEASARWKTLYLRDAAFTALRVGKVAEAQDFASQLKPLDPGYSAFVTGRLLANDKKIKEAVDSYDEGLRIATREDTKAILWLARGELFVPRENDFLWQRKAENLDAPIRDVLRAAQIIRDAQIDAQIKAEAHATAAKLMVLAARNSNQPEGRRKYRLDALTQLREATKLQPDFMWYALGAVLLADLKDDQDAPPIPQATKEQYRTIGLQWWEFAKKARRNKGDQQDLDNIKARLDAP
jgi:hypothetical protein